MSEIQRITSHSHAAVRARRSAEVCVTAAHGLIDFVGGHGVGSEELLASVGLSQSILEGSRNKIALSQFCDLLERAAQNSSHGDIGLEFGSRFMPQNLGFIGYLAASAANLGDALQSFSRFLPLHQQGTYMDLEVCFGDRVALSYSIIDCTVTRRRQDAELSLAVMLNLIRSALGATWAPDEVHFAHSRPLEGIRQHEALFKAPVYFQQNCNRLVLPKSAFDAPMPRHDPLLYDLILSEFIRLAPRTGHRIDLISMVQHHIERQLAAGGCDLESVAAACGVAPWTLRRRLHAAGLKFQQIVVETRYRLALGYLHEQEMSVTETALALGYSETSAFSRAFRQWTGIPPTRFAAERRDMNG